MEKRLLLGIALFAAMGMAALAMTGRGTAPLPPEPDLRFVHAKNGHLELNGERYRFIGVNVYSMLSAKDRKSGFVCGIPHNRAERKAILREVKAFGGNVIRISAYQTFTGSGTDYAELDETIAFAKQQDVRLILILEGQWGHCSTGKYMTPTWYRNGYRYPYDENPISYLSYVRRIVTHYKDEPTILAWQLMNEAESSAGAIAIGVPDPDALYGFARDMSAEIRSIDRNHLISLGTIDDSRAGMGTIDYANVLQLSTVDLAEGHDYDTSQPYPMNMRRCQKIAELTKVPFFIGEVGVSTENLAPGERANLLMGKLDAAWCADVDGILIWSYRAGDGHGFDIWPDDPIIPKLKQFTKVRLPAHKQ